MSCIILRPARLVAAALALSLPSFPSIAIAASTVPSAGSIEIALLTHGDISPFRNIAQDTLASVDNGDIAAARSRIKDLETAWDQAEPRLKPKDTKAWIALDTMIDDALTNLRMPSPKTDECASSLKALIANMDAIAKA